MKWYYLSLIDDIVTLSQIGWTEAQWRILSAQSKTLEAKIQRVNNGDVSKLLEYGNPCIMYWTVRDQSHMDCSVRVVASKSNAAKRAATGQEDYSVTICLQEIHNMGLTFCIYTALR